MVVGAPSAQVSSLLDSCADREGRGGATIWRLSPVSVRRALDDGTTGPELEQLLSSIANAELPQPLRYLIADVARRHGSLRVSPAISVIRSEDTALLAEVAADRKLKRLGLRLLAPHDPDLRRAGRRGAGCDAECRVLPPARAQR